MAVLTLVLAMLNAVEKQGLAVASVEAGFGAETCGGAGGGALALARPFDRLALDHARFWRRLALWRFLDRLRALWQKQRAGRRCLQYA